MADVVSENEEVRLIDWLSRHERLLELVETALELERTEIGIEKKDQSSA
jgi:hypothetical protein